MTEFIYRKSMKTFTEYDLEAIRRYMKSIDFIYFKSKKINNKLSLNLLLLI